MVNDSFGDVKLLKQPLVMLAWRDNHFWELVIERPGLLPRTPSHTLIDSKGDQPPCCELSWETHVAGTEWDLPPTASKKLNPDVSDTGNELSPSCLQMSPQPWPRCIYHLVSGLEAVALSSGMSESPQKLRIIHVCWLTVASFASKLLHSFY